MVNTLVCGTSIQGFDSLTPPHLRNFTHLLSFKIYNLYLMKLVVFEFTTSFLILRKSGDINAYDKLETYL